MILGPPRPIMGPPRVILCWLGQFYRPRPIMPTITPRGGPGARGRPYGPAAPPPPSGAGLNAQNALFSGAPTGVAERVEGQASDVMQNEYGNIF